MKTTMPAGVWRTAGLFAQVAVLLICHVAVTLAAMPSATDVFLSPYPTIADPPPNGFLLWSKTSTWPSGFVPGIGKNVGADVVVPPGNAILLDVANVTLGSLQIKGLLKVKDDSSLPAIYVKANSVLVEGQLSIGSTAQYFRQKLTFELTPNPNNRRPLLFTSFLPADPMSARNLGHKAFAVVGGQLDLHGLPFPSSVPVWCRLIQSARVGDTKLIVDCPKATQWPVGGQIAVASTDYQRLQSEVFTIVKVTSTGAGATLFVDKPFKYMHWGQAKGISDGFGGFVNEQAEVALLSRNIRITGTDEPPPFQFEGGHFIIFMTDRPQHIEGVELWKMGQQGTLGRYSMHFHVVGSAPGNVVRKNTIRDSKQRCIVLHASHNITIDSNVAYNTSGHCFMTEEGGEQNNTFIGNIGMLTNAVVRRIPSGSDPTSSDETDDEPSTFWITHATNNFIDNVATGSASAGFWIELRRSVRGMSLSIPSLANIVPRRTIFGQYSGNFAHSNTGFGFRLYPHGSRPRNQDGSPAVATISGLNIYKTSFTGMFIHDVDSLILDNLTTADNFWGVYMNQGETTTIQNSRMLALTSNIGNPSQCWRGDPWGDCKPLKGCSMPLSSPNLARSTGGMYRTAAVLGLLVDQGNRSAPGNTPVHVVSTSFSNFSSTCNLAAGIALVGDGDLFNPAQTMKNLSFTPDSNRIWAAPKVAAYNPWHNPHTSGEQYQFYALRDIDGSVIGGPGFVVANNKYILPPNNTGCKFHSKWNAYGCLNTCYRDVQISFYEPGFSPLWAPPVNRTRGMFSSLRFTRDIDGRSFVVDGNMDQLYYYNQNDLTQRFFHVNILANYSYTVSILPSKTAPGFIPTNITIRYKDGTGCGLGLTLRFPPTKGVPWALTDGDNLSFRQCPKSGIPPSANVTSVYSYDCISKQPWLRITLAPMLNKMTMFPGTDTKICSRNQPCSLLWSGASDWLYVDDGLERRPDFYLPAASRTWWKQGLAPLGFTTWGSTYIMTDVSQPNPRILTYFFRRSFTLKDSRCYTSLNIKLIQEDGVVLYLNNKEIGRSGMPSGNITNSTLASEYMKEAFTWVDFNISLTGAAGNILVEGTNVIAVEQHVFASWAWQLAMDMRVSAVRLSSSCTGANIKAEVCDGLDNNFNGKIDEGMDELPLSMPCETACGRGVATCTGGQYVCNMRIPTEEICNGVDDDCDGAVDNGIGQLDCDAGNVCFRGQCLPFINATQPVPIFARNTSGWSYYDQGGDFVEVRSPYWKNGIGTSAWKVGQGPLGFNRYAPDWDWAKTTINSFGSDGVSMTAYFVKPFTLTQADVDNTFSLDFNVRRVDGAIISVNGVELSRTNMPDGPVTYKTRAAGNTQGKESSPGSGCCNLQWVYYPCTSCYRNSTSSLQVGVNWIAAEVHLAYAWEKNFAFDMDLFQNVKQACPSGACVRQVTRDQIWARDTWEFLDGSLPLPPTTWMLTNYTSESWKTGAAPIGVGPQWLIRTKATWGGTADAPQTTFFFRKTIQIPDAACYFQVNGTILANDGAVVYINGREVFRWQLPTGRITFDSFAFYGGDWQYHPFIVTGGWLTPGANVIAVELHRAQGSTQNMFFDLQMSASREGLSCNPLPM